MSTNEKNIKEIEEMNVTRGLSEITMLDKRITGSIRGNDPYGDNASRPRFVSARKKSSPVVEHVHKLEDFKTNAIASIQKIKALIKRRNRIKSAIVQSNAITDLVIGNKTYKVAEAIERKESIKYEKELLIELESQYAKAIRVVNNENSKVDRTIDSMYETILGRDNAGKISVEADEFKEYRNKNEWELVDPLEVENLIKEMRDEIMEFEMNVDYALSEKNALTKIKIEKVS